MKDNPFINPTGVTFGLPASDGTKTLRATFGEKLFLVPAFEHLADYISPSRDEVEEEIGVLDKSNGTFSEIYNGFGIDLKKLSHTPAQVCDLASCANRVLEDPCFVLIDADGEFFVGIMFFYEEGFPELDVRKFEYDEIFSPHLCLRIVTPQKECDVLTRPVSQPLTH